MQETKIREILYEYQKKREKNSELVENRIKEIHKKYPDIKKIDIEIENLGRKMILSFSKSTHTNRDESTGVQTLKENIDNLIELKKRLISSYGYPKDYLDEKFDCELCHDTGFLENGERCSCLEQILINERYKVSNIEKILDKENFLNFNFEVFSKDIEPKEGKSQRENIENIFYDIQYFIRDFDKENIFFENRSGEETTLKKNLLFTGYTGNGKTYLCSCITKELIDRGKNVIYLTAPNLMSVVEEYKFSNKNQKEDYYSNYKNLFNVDLLIIDDLGSEHRNDFSIPEILNIINSRINSDKSTIISTNLNMLQLGDAYTDRLLSRIIGNFEIYEFFGPDLRLK